MKVDYFIKTEADSEFYEKYIKYRLPSKIIDMHIHMTKPEFNQNIVKDPNSWASQCDSIMEFEDYSYYSKMFYPDKTVYVNALPSVTKGIDIDGNNAYIAELKRNGKIQYAHMLINPEWNGEYTEKVFTEGNFDGYKPYPDYVSGARGTDIGLFDFMNREQLEILNRHKKTMVLHLPRKGRFPDDSNIRELLEMREKYPDIKVIIAHCGRSYSIYYIREAAKKLGSAMNAFHYDFAAVINPEVIDFMFANVSHDLIMYGTDLPIFLWHGKRRWTYTQYYNLSREKFQWNIGAPSDSDESDYTFFIYEQLKNILDMTDKYGGKILAEKIFHDNAVKLIER